MCDWILKNLGNSVPLHFTAFHPDFKVTDKPRTPISTLQMAREIALSSGIKYYYLGNVIDRESQTTYCPKCKTPLIERDWHTIQMNNLAAGKCNKCDSPIAGRF